MTIAKYTMYLQEMWTFSQTGKDETQVLTSTPQNAALFISTLCTNMQFIILFRIL